MKSRYLGCNDSSKQNFSQEIPSLKEDALRTPWIPGNPGSIALMKLYMLEYSSDKGCLNSLVREMTKRISFSIFEIY